MTEQLDPEDLPDAIAERARLAAELDEKARQAFARNEPLVATLHACDAVMLAPNERRHLDTFDEVVLSVQDPLQLVPIATGAIHVATAAGRARVLMMQRNMGEAVDLLCRAIDVVPHVAYLDWIRRWFDVPHVLPSLSWEQVFETVVKTCINLVVDVPVPPADDDPRLDNVRAAAQVMAKLRGHYPGQAVLYVGEVMARRRLGDAQATLAVAREGASQFGQDWNVVCALANAAADAGDLGAALQAARQALALRGDDYAPLRDVAVAHMRHGQAAQAAQLLQEVHDNDPGYPGIVANLHHARYRAHGSEEDRVALLTLRDRQWWNDEVRELADEIAPPEPYLTVLGGPGDATANAARHLLRELAHVVRCCGIGGHLEVRLTGRYPESPSVSVSFDAGLRKLGARGRLQLSAEAIPQPDPRVDKTTIAHHVWRFAGEQPEPVNGEADPQLQQRIAAIADQLFSRERWDAAAAQLASELGPQSVPGLLAVLTHPPVPPDHFDGVFWTYRCQIAVAVVFSHLGPYPQEPARSAITSLLYGPADWVTCAGIVALTWRAHTDPNVRAEAEQIFAWLRGQIPAEGYTPWELTLAECWLGLNPEPQTKADIDAWIERYFDTIGDKNTVRTPERRYGGLTLEQYAQFCMERDRLIGTIGYNGPGAAIQAFVGGQVPPALYELCERFGVPPHHPETGVVYPWIAEWQEAMNADPDLHHEFLEIQRAMELEQQGVSREEKAALDNILDGNMDMHQRMAQAQTAQRTADDGDPDPVVFPGQPVARLSDYVGIMKRMQGGDFNGALAAYGLDMMSYGSVAQAWGAKLAADPVLTEKFTRMMG